MKESGDERVFISKLQAGMPANTWVFTKGLLGANERFWVKVSSKTLRIFILK